RPGTAGYGLAESWTGTVFARWMRDGDLVEVGPRRAGRQEVRRRLSEDTTTVVTDVEAGGFHTCSADGWLGWLTPRHADPYRYAGRVEHRLADQRRGIAGWQGNAVHLHDGRRLAVVPESAGTEVVPEPPAVAGGRMVLTVARPDAAGRRHSGRLFVDLHTG